MDQERKRASRPEDLMRLLSSARMQGTRKASLRSTNRRPCSPTHPEPSAGAARRSRHSTVGQCQGCYLVNGRPWLGPSTGPLIALRSVLVP